MKIVSPNSHLLWTAVVVAVSLASGCAWLRSEPQMPKEVKVQVPVPCVDPKQRPVRPVLRTEDELLAMDRYRRTLAAWADLKKYELYVAELEATVEGCARLK